MDDPGAQLLDEEAVQGAVTLYRAAVGLRPAIGTDAARRVVLAAEIADDLALARAATLECLLACLTADLSGALLRTTSTEGARRSAALLRSVPGLGSIATAVEHRHERVDGSGHPLGLGGEDIPLGARMIALTHVLVGHRRGAIDWDRRIEETKDSAGAAVDVVLAQHAHEVCTRPAVRDKVEAATPDHAIALINRIASPTVSLTRLTRLVDTGLDPVALSRGLLDQLWRATGFTAVGVQRFGATTERLAVIGVDHGVDLARTPASAHLALGHGSTVCVETVADPAGRTSWGAVWGVTEREVPSDHDRDGLADVAGAIGRALGRIRRQEELDAHAHRDQLTGLANRRQLERELAALFDGPPSRRTDAALVMCDVDGLKSVNDTRGHAAGDDVLRAVAAVLEAALAGIDGFAARLGGDEFCLVLRSGGILHAQTVARRAAAGVLASVAGDVGLSCGIAYAARASTPRELLSGADLAQYEVKRRRPSGDTRPGAVPGRRRRRDR